MTSGETTIRVPVFLRERVKAEAARSGLTQADLIELARRELDQAEFLRAVGAVEWDAAGWSSPSCRAAS